MLSTAVPRSAAVLRAVVAAIAALALLAIPMAAPSSAGGSSTRTVVAVIDSSTNPYHEFFQTERSSVTPAVLGVRHHQEPDYHPDADRQFRGRLRR